MYMEGEKLQTTEERFLLSAMQRGDLKAYGVLFRRYYPMLCAYATKFVELKDAGCNAVVMGKPGNANLRDVT